MNLKEVYPEIVLFFESTYGHKINIQNIANYVTNSYYTDVNCVNCNSIFGIDLGRSKGDFINECIKYRDDLYYRITIRLTTHNRSTKLISCNEYIIKGIIE